MRKRAELSGTAGVGGGTEARIPRERLRAGESWRSGCLVRQVTGRVSPLEEGGEGGGGGGVHRKRGFGGEGGTRGGGQRAGSVCARLGGRTAPGVWGRGRPLGPERSLGPRAGRGHQGVDTGKAGPRCFSRRRRALKAGPGQTAEWEATGPQAECASKPGAEKKQSTGRLSRRDERRRTRSPRAASTQLQHPFPSLPALASVSHKTLDSWYDCHLEQRQWMPEGTQ